MAVHSPGSWPVEKHTFSIACSAARPPDQCTCEKRLLPWIALEWLAFIAMLVAAQVTVDLIHPVVLYVSAGVLFAVMLWQGWRAAADQCSATGLAAS
jgi:hypothetical protein